MQYIGEIFVFVGLNSWSPIVQKVWLMPQNIVHLGYCLHCRIDWLEHLKLLPTCHFTMLNHALFRTVVLVSVFLVLSAYGACSTYQHVP